MGQHSKGLEKHGQHSKGLGKHGQHSKGLGKHGAVWGSPLKGWGIMGQHGETL